MTLLSLYKYAEENDIEIDCFRLEHIECFSLLDKNGCVIVFDPLKIRSERDETIKLAHEMGHCMTGAFYKQGDDPILIAKQEQRAVRWEVCQLIPQDELIEAFHNGYIEVWELAEYFNVTEEFMKKALMHYGCFSC